MHPSGRRAASCPHGRSMRQTDPMPRPAHGCRFPEAPGRRRNAGILPRTATHGFGFPGCHESTDNIPGRDVIRGLPYGAFIVRGVDTHRHGCWAAAWTSRAAGRNSATARGFPCAIPGCPPAAFACADALSASASSFESTYGPASPAHAVPSSSP